MCLSLYLLHFIDTSTGVSKLQRHQIYVNPFGRCENRPAHNLENGNYINSHFARKKPIWPRYFWYISGKLTIYPGSKDIPSGILS